MKILSQKKCKHLVNVSLNNLFVIRIKLCQELSKYVNINLFIPRKLTRCYNILTILLLLLISCKIEKKQEGSNNFTLQKLAYAKGFKIYKNENQTKIVVKNAYQNATDSLVYLIEKPFKKLIVTSTTHIPMLELLQSEHNLIAFPNTQYVSSKKTRKLIDNGSIKEIGQEANLNTEIILNLQPDVVVGFSVNSANKSLDFLKNNGINVIYNGDWLEETPLGRAEWIKFFGILTGKEQLADSIFKKIESDYLKTKEIALKSKLKPTILSGAVAQNDSWTLPAGQSYMAHFFADANTNYLWKNTNGTGSLSLSIESIFEKGQTADFWIAPSFFNTKEQLKSSNKLISEFKAFKNNTIYTPNLKTGTTGGILFFEQSTTRPDLVLKDLIKITHPELLQNYEFNFFEQMK